VSRAGTAQARLTGETTRAKFPRFERAGADFFHDRFVETADRSWFAKICCVAESSDGHNPGHDTASAE
jgi:hypothetical protein